MVKIVMIGIVVGLFLLYMIVSIVINWNRSALREKQNERAEIRAAIRRAESNDKARFV